MGKMVIFTAMDDRNRWLLWALALGAAAIVCVPSTMMIQALDGYRRFLTGFDPAAIRPTTPRRLAHREARRSDVDPALEFVEFRHKAPKAKAVELIGDFNGWKRGSLLMARQRDGSWELLLPLPRGTHSYLFIVDEAEMLDPSRPKGGELGRKVSVVTVK